MRPLKWQIMSVSTNKFSRFLAEHSLIKYNLMGIAEWFGLGDTRVSEFLVCITNFLSRNNMFGIILNGGSMEVLPGGKEEKR